MAETFAEREIHLRQRAERGWIEDEDVAICMREIDRLHGICRALGDFHSDHCVFWQHEGHCTHERADVAPTSVSDSDALGGSRHGVES